MRHIYVRQARVNDDSLYTGISVLLQAAKIWTGTEAVESIGRNRWGHGTQTGLVNSTPRKCLNGQGLSRVQITNT